MPSCLGTIIGWTPLAPWSILVWKIKHMDSQVVCYVIGMHFMCMLPPSRSVMSDTLWPRGLYPTSAHGIFQGRILDWVAISFSRESSRPRKRTHTSSVSCNCEHVLYQQCHLGSPGIHYRSQVINVSTKLECDNTWRWQWGKNERKVATN